MKLKKNEMIIIDKNTKINFLNELVFVAIKNGMHDSKGYVFCSPNLRFKFPKEPVHVSEIHDIILKCF